MGSRSIGVTADFAAASSRDKCESSLRGDLFGRPDSALVPRPIFYIKNSRRGAERSLVLAAMRRSCQYVEHLGIWEPHRMIDSIAAVTLATHDMARAVRFYRTLSLEIVHGGAEAEFTSFRAGAGYLNLTAQPVRRHWTWWGRVIFYESDVDGLYTRLIGAGYQPHAEPHDAEWGERFFHVTDPDGHELSFAWPNPKA
jgi:catechol 2,3-dioxygenase-like lactoylglutathione lyase family enzyme